METLEIRAVIKYFCKKGMPPKEIHEDFMENLGQESPSYSTVIKWKEEFKRGWRGRREVGVLHNSLTNDFSQFER